MNFNFIVFDKLNSVAFECFSLARFSFNNVDYLMYSRINDTKKCSVYTSRLVKNANESYSIYDISNDEKVVLNDISRNVFATLPTSYSDGVDIDKFVNDFCFENKIVFSKEVPSFGEQFLCDNSLLADSSLEYCNFVRSFYDAILPRVNILPLTSSVVWELPSGDSELTKPNLVINSYADSISEPSTSNYSASTDVNPIGLGNIETIIPITEGNEQAVSTVSESHDATLNVDRANGSSNRMDNFNFQIFGDSTVNNNLDYANTNNVNNHSNDFSFNFNIPSSYGIQDNTSSGGGPVLQSNKTKVLKKNAGFASNSYIIIGSLCLVLSMVIIAISIFFVKNL